MGKKDYEIRIAIKTIIDNDYSGRHLKYYFSVMPDKSIRRAINILSKIYPDKTTISDDDFLFITYMFSNVKFMEQESFFQFVRAVNILNFTDHQKAMLINTIKNSIEILSDKCTFELDALLMNLFEPDKLIQYFEALIENKNRSVLQRIFYILLYEDFSQSYGLDKKIEALKLKVSTLIKC